MGSRACVYVSRNASVLVTQEYSGSNDALSFYNTQTCQRVASVDVSKSPHPTPIGRSIRVTIHHPLHHETTSALVLPSACHR
ncbi:hypothetical protein [Limnobacter sp.]|uniref:hypothetical protein n=1 Tax=Limnobacter sp. TaxID=2003368 RepID=UPI0039C92BCE